MSPIRATIHILACLSLLYQCESAVFISDYAMNRMIEMMPKHPFCQLHTDRGFIQHILLTTDPKKVRHMPPDSVDAIIKVCKETNGIQGEVQGGLGFIYPGTKWCGPGTIAKDHGDVGRYAEEDRCCREHDLCPNTLSPGECKRSLCNGASFTRSHCDCDAKFRRCLQAVNTETANTLGAVFFNVIQVTCFKERRPCSVHQRDACPLDLTVSDPYITYPLLSALIPSKASTFLGNLFKKYKFNSQRSFKGLGYGQTKALYFFDSAGSHAGDYAGSGYATVDLTSEDGTVNPNVRLASLGLAAKNIFQDIVVRPLSGFTKFLQTSVQVFNWNNSPY